MPVAMNHSAFVTTLYCWQQWAGGQARAGLAAGPPSLGEAAAIAARPRAASRCNSCCFCSSTSTGTPRRQLTPPPAALPRPPAAPPGAPSPPRAAASSPKRRPQSCLQRGAHAQPAISGRGALQRLPAPLHGCHAPQGRSTVPRGSADHEPPPAWMAIAECCLPGPRPAAHLVPPAPPQLPSGRPPAWVAGPGSCQRIRQPTGSCWQALGSCWHPLGTRGGWRTPALALSWRWRASPPLQGQARAGQLSGSVGGAGGSCAAWRGCVRRGGGQGSRRCGRTAWAVREEDDGATWEGLAVACSQKWHGAPGPAG
jgi:hypothetical protein